MFHTHGQSHKSYPCAASVVISPPHNYGSLLSTPGRWPNRCIEMDAPPRKSLLTTLHTYLTTDPLPQPAIRPDVSPLDAGGETGIKLHYVSCHPPSGVETKGTILLIHGFPQTWYQFRRVITPLSDAGYHIIVPDYRGAGDSTKPSQYEAVFTKAVMAGDLRILVRKVEGVQGKVHVVGHDMYATVIC